MISIINYTQRIFHDRIMSELNHIGNALNFKVNNFENDYTWNFKNHDWRLHIDRYNTSVTLLLDNNLEIVAVKEYNGFEKDFIEWLNKFLIDYNENIPY